ncbi:MAG: ankyrin repeat domain-containing protein [Ignavibacteriales bacterium]|nr:ankyrin repeat domain-containing protein [Ignavibacteriales bacterium]
MADEKENLIRRIANGRTDLVFDYQSKGFEPNSCDSNGVSLIKWCAYYGDVSALRFLITHGESLSSLGENFDLNGAVFHGHWQATEFLIEQGADPNYPLPETGETPLHNVLCTMNRLAHDLVLKILLTHGANPNCVTRASVATGSFMRDCRTKGETPLHRAAAFGNEETIQLLLDAGAKAHAKDMNGDSPLSWASWYARPDSILKKLCYGDYAIHPARQSLEVNLLGKPYL